MPVANLKIKEASLVFIGMFKPVVFHPQWLLRKGFVSELDADEAQIGVTSPEITQFSISNYTLTAVEDRLMFSSVQEPYFDSMKDVALGILGAVPDMAIAQMGINLHFHYGFNDLEDYIDFGHRILPKENLWNKFLKNPGLASLSVQSERSDEYEGRIVTFVKISSKVQPGVEIYVNDHYSLYPVETKIHDVTSSQALKILGANWNQSIENSSKIIEGVRAYGSSTD